MTIDILTTFDVYNYGASLQAYALQTFLRNAGHEVRLIDYQPAYLHQKYNYMWVNPESSMSRHLITRWLYRGMKFLQRQTTMRRKKAFDRFNSTELVRTPLKYTNRQSILNEPPKADTYIVGSDQVWNVFYETGCDDTFFLDFANEGKKISYAASFSFLDIDNEGMQRIQSLLRSFDAVGVREFHGVELLKKINIPANWTLDPVFLLTDREWKAKVTPFRSKEPYMLVYDFEGNDDIKRFAMEYARSRGLKIYSITDTYPKFYAHRNFNGAGPWEFISLIMGCDAFVSNSFHGTVFSIIFNKPVFVFTRKRHKVNSRMESLLHLFGLSDVLYDEFDATKPIPEFTADYALINKIIQRERQKSINFLESSL